MRSTGILLSGLVGIACLAGSSGCTYTIEPNVRMAGEAITLDKYDGEAVLWVTPEFEGYTKKQVDISDNIVWKFVLGGESVDMFRDGLAKLFAAVDVQKHEGPPQAGADGRARLIVYPEIIDTKCTFPVAFKFENYTSKVTYRVTVYDPAGKQLLSETFEGKGVERGHCGYSSAGHDALPVSLRKAMVSAMRGCLDALASSAALRDASRQTIAARSPGNNSPQSMQ